MTKPTLDPLLSLAFSVHSNPGVYAVLVGSGISRAASIPTGWDVVLELVRKVAALQGDDCGSDPAGWYAAKFGEDPDYGKLLKEVAKRPAERQSLLRSYFEANDDERSKGLKQPTKAHKAIAALVQSGHVRVIVTTNFDHLTEQSLEAIGISPTVISTADGADGATPLTHTKCTIIKVHGDYLDARIKNTPEELAKYNPRMNKLLDRVFDEFGLIVCGWSGDWDEALRAAMQRCKNRRYTTYWCVRGKLSPAADKLVQHRGAEVVTGSDADALFVGLQQKVEALAAFNRPHPLSVATAVASAKRFLSNPQPSIELSDMVHVEVEKIVGATSDKHMPCNGVGFQATEARHRIERCDAMTEILAAVFAAGCYWGSDGQRMPWARALDRLGSKDSASGSSDYLSLRRYPAARVLYAGGVAAVASDKYKTVKALLLDTRVRARDKERVVVDVLDVFSVLDQRTAQKVFGNPDEPTPMSEHLFVSLREPLRSYLPDDVRYEMAFEKFEYLFALACVDQALRRGDTAEDYVSIPPGRYTWRRSFMDNVSYTAQAVREERHAAGAAWGPILAGLFDSEDRFDNADRVMAARLAKMRPFR